MPAGGDFAATLVELTDQAGYSVAQRLLDFLDLAPTDATDVFDLGFGSGAGG